MLVSRGVGYPALRQAPYVALVVPAYGEIVRYCVEVPRGVGYPALGQAPYVALVSRGVGYPALRQTPYVALVVPAYEERCDSMAWSHVA
ncbi:organic cation/carnitine transporter 3 [Prunus dulcis]|uniref:Organic cation/carnitine transporter 3 n=1 Tax=Prunus dulcis TaxID=3755 RepID=A0A4Y1QZP1_PRUDU|nr:organic cation/carnitine transporter 3 [Prunus dulcis]